MKKYSLLLMCFLLQLIVLSGCKDNTVTEDSAGNTKSINSISSTITSGGSVTVGISQDLDSLDPHNTVYAGTREVLFNIYEGLVKPTSEGELVPAVAESFTLSEDARTYTFTLRQGLTFHDGSKVTAEDIKYSIERYAGIQGKESAFSIFEKVIIVDEKKMEVHLTEGNSEFLANFTLAILPKVNNNPAENPMGTGPFKIAKFTPGQSLKVVKFEGYRTEGVPYLDEVTFKIVSDVSVAFTQLQAGSIDVLQYLTADQITTLNNKFQIVEGSVNYVQGLFLNNAFEPFRDSNVRKAVCYAIDRKAINEFVFAGKSHVIQTNMIPGFAKYYNKSTETTYEKDIEKAKTLMKEAGYENGFDLVITVPNNYPPHQTVAEVIIEQLKEIGIRATIKLVEFTSWVSDAYTKRNYEATVVAVDGTLAPSSWFEKNVSTGVNNFTNYADQSFDATFEAARKTIDAQEKISLYHELQKILAETAASAYIQDPANLIAINKNLTGYQCYPVAAQDMSIVGFVKQS